MKPIVYAPLLLGLAVIFSSCVEERPRYRRPVHRAVYRDDVRVGVYDDRPVYRDDRYYRGDVAPYPYQRDRPDVRVQF